MDVANVHQQWYASSIFGPFNLIWVVLKETFIGPQPVISYRQFSDRDLVQHLEHSIWTLELEHALESFSLSTYLNWIDDHITCIAIYIFLLTYEDSPEKLLHYLEREVRNPCSQTKFQFQLIILIRENLAFITTIWPVIWSVLTFPWTILQLERNSVS